MFTLARGYAERGMSAYVELQDAEFAAEADGYTATQHQREVGTGYFDPPSGGGVHIVPQDTSPPPDLS